METSPLYQPEVLLMNSLNLKIREKNLVQHENCGDGDEIVVLDDNILSISSRVKRRSVGGDLCNSESKRGRQDDDELLLLEAESDDNDDLVNIQNLLEVSIEEGNEIIEVDLEPEEVDLESEEVDLEPEEVDLEPEEVEVLHLDEQNNIEDMKLEPH